MVAIGPRPRRHGDGAADVGVPIGGDGGVGHGVDPGLDFWMLRYCVGWVSEA
jgi:hypothetical protein